MKEAKGYKTKLKRHKDAVLVIHSVDGINGEFLMSGSADHTVRSKLFFICFCHFFGNLKSKFVIGWLQCGILRRGNWPNR